MSVLDKYDLNEPEIPVPAVNLPSEGLVLLVGSSGSGKSTILRQHFELDDIPFSANRLIDDFTSHERAEELLIACGLRSIPTWVRAYSSLSNGEAHRAFCARSIDVGREFIDEFSSVVDRDTAKSLAVALKKWFDRSEQKRLVVATCHRDIQDWLCPDAVYDTDQMAWESGRLLRRPRPHITVEVTPCHGETVWEHVKKHHYLSHNFNRSANCWAATINGKLVGFTSVIAFPSGSLKDAWREHRTVVVPEFQGLGIGNKLSEAVGDWVASTGGRYFSKTSHPAMGEHRNRSGQWRPTSKNGKNRLDYKSEGGAYHTASLQERDKSRACYSHEYICEKGVDRDTKFN